MAGGGQGGRKGPRTETGKFVSAEPQKSALICQQMPAMPFAKKETPSEPVVIRAGGVRHDAGEHRAVPEPAPVAVQAETRNRTSLVIVLAIAAGAAALVDCSGDDSSSARRSAPVSSPANPADQSPVTVQINGSR